MYHTEFGRRLRTQSSGGASSPSSIGSLSHGRSDPYGPGASSDRLFSHASSSGTSASASTSTSTSTSNLAAELSHSDMYRPANSTSSARGMGIMGSAPGGLSIGMNGDAPRSAAGGSTYPAGMERPRTPGKAKAGSYGDRFIPSRDGSDMQAAYQLMAEDPSTPHRHKRKIATETDAQKEEANQAFSSLLSSELFGLDAAPSPSTSRPHSANANANAPSGSSSSIHSSGGSSATRHSTLSGLPTPSTPTKKNLFSYKSPSRSRGTPGKGGGAADGGHSRSNSAGGGGGGGGTGTGGGGGGLFGGMTGSSAEASTLDSPTHKAYSLSPVKLESQRLLLSPRRAPRTLSKVPYKVLDAPELADDFYLNLVDWSSSNTLGVGLGSCVYLWEAKTSSVTRLCDLRGDDKITGLNWADRGSHLAVGTNRGMVQIWDAEHCKLVRTMRGHTGRVGSLAWNGPILTSGSRDRTILHRDVRVPSQHIRELQGHRQEVCGLKWNAETNQLASGGNDNKLLVWDGLSSTPVHRFTDHTAAVKAIAWNPHQHGILASGGGTADMKIRFWNTLTGSMTSEIDTGSQVCNLMWSKTSNELVSTHGYSGGKIQNQIQVWKYPAMTQVATLTGHTMRVLYLAMSPDGETIVTGAGDETLRFWDLNTPSKSMVEKRNESTKLNPFAKIR